MGAAVNNCGWVVNCEPRVVDFDIGRDVRGDWGVSKEQFKNMLMPRNWLFRLTMSKLVFLNTPWEKRRAEYLTGQICYW